MVLQILQKILPPAHLVTNLRHYCEGKTLPTSHRVTSLDKRFLVWTGKYKTLEEVPELVARTVIDRTRNRMRIRIANLMIAATISGCCLMIYLGKKDAREGKSAQQQNLDWHKKINEDFKRENAEAAAAAAAK